MSSHSLAFRFALHLIVEQQALSPDAYHYWSRIHALRYNVGSLFDPPPEATFGNVANVADPTDRALGYFTVGALVTSETCVSQHDFDEFPPLGRPLVLFGVCGETISGSLVPPPDFVQACRNR